MRANHLLANSMINSFRKSKYSSKCDISRTATSPKIHVLWKINDEVSAIIKPICYNILEEISPWDSLIEHFIDN